jgi:hypothetical protein
LTHCRPIDGVAEWGDVLDFVVHDARSSASLRSRR